MKEIILAEFPKTTRALLNTKSALQIIGFLAPFVVMFSIAMIGGELWRGEYVTLISMAKDMLISTILVPFLAFVVIAFLAPFLAIGAVLDFMQKKQWSKYKNLIGTAFVVFFIFSLPAIIMLWSGFFSMIVFGS